MKAALIDHNDSFTANLQHWLKPLFQQVDLIQHEDFFSSKSKFREMDYSLHVLSPGPKSPTDYPQTLHWLSQRPQRQPIFGVCLGLQMMIVCEGGSVQPYGSPVHGKVSSLEFTTTRFQASELKVARYHSLKCEPSSTHWQCLARAQDDQVPMWFQHQQKKWMGVQFHPESFLTERPEWHQLMLKEWLNS